MTVRQSKAVKTVKFHPSNPPAKYVMLVPNAKSPLSGLAVLMLADLYATMRALMN